MSSGGRTVPRGGWARIHRVELAPSERASEIPADTAAVPFETWINGWLLEDVELGEPARLRTPTGRIVEGVLVEAGPGYSHSFGSPPPSLQAAGTRAWARLFGGETS
jgi:hypothetical protein